MKPTIHHRFRTEPGMKYPVEHYILLEISQEHLTTLMALVIQGTKAPMAKVLGPYATKEDQQLAHVLIPELVEVFQGLFEGMQLTATK